MTSFPTNEELDCQHHYLAFCDLHHLHDALARGEKEEGEEEAEEVGEKCW